VWMPGNKRIIPRPWNRESEGENPWHFTAARAAAGFFRREEIKRFQDWRKLNCALKTWRALRSATENTTGTAQC
jgi:hypothetical protein